MKTVAIPLLLTAAILCGCSHKLDVTNLDVYTAGQPNHSHREVSVAVSPVNSTDRDEVNLALRTGDALARLGGYKMRPATEQWGQKPDVVVRLSIKNAEKTGNAGNFFICWPGFFLFTHAWLGYGYSCEFDVLCEIMDGTTGDCLDSLEMNLPLEMRHAEFDRTWANGYAWMAYSITAIFNGIYCQSWDPDLDDKLYTLVYPKLGEELAKPLMKKINALPWQTLADPYTY